MCLIRNFHAAEDEKNLEQYLKDSNFSGAVSIASASTLCQAASHMPQDAVMPIHSLGKVFTGMLLMVGLEQWVIKAADLDKPIQLEPSVLERLPKKLQEHLKNVSLRHAMVHEGGLGDYLNNYMKNYLAKSPPEPIHSIEDLLKYADEETSAIESERYSNLGSLLFGLSLQYHFNKGKKTYTPFNELLRQYIVGPADLASYSDRLDILSPATPAGGQWMKVEDLQKFGTWITKQTALHPFIEEHGREFCNQGVVSHLGALENGGSAYVTAYLKEGISIAVLSTQDRLSGQFAAEKIDAAVKHTLFYRA